MARTRQPTNPWLGGWFVAVATFGVIVAAQLAVDSSRAASSSTVVGATVPSATTLDVSGCAPGVPGKTELGVVLPGASATTSIDCDVAFGSSNDTAQLRINQLDGGGVGMWAPTTGMWETTFDGPSGTADGRFLQAIGGWDDYTTEVAVDANGDIVIAGGCSAANFDFCLARFDGTSGAFDTTFDGPLGTGDGRFLTSIAAGADFVNDLAFQPDGKILAVGNCYPGGNSDFCIARFNTDGSYDTSFDGPSGTANGRFVMAIGSGDDVFHSVEVRPDGRIVASGYCYNGSNDDFCFVGLRADGSLDPTFDGPSGTGNGSFLLPVGTGSDTLSDAALQDDGKLVAVGRCFGATTNDACLVRLGETGALDVTFDGPSGSADGAFIEPIGPAHDNIGVVTIQSDGRIVVAGMCQGGTGGDDFCLARYETTGARDVTFDGPSGSGNGEFLVAIAGGGTIDTPNGVVQQEDGRLVVAGRCGSSCVVRFSADGSLDASFGGPSGTGDGKALFSISGNSDYGLRPALRPDGRLVGVGYCLVAAQRDACIATFDNEGEFDDYVTGGGADRDWASGPSTSFFATCLRAVSGGATADWISNDPCDAVDGPYWRAVPASTDKVAHTVALEPDPPDATAHLRFGLRAASNQPPGAYIAPIRFDVLAPDA